MKETIIKVVTAVLCVVALCVTSFVAVGNYSDALKEAAKLTGTASSESGSTENTETDTPSDEVSDVPADDTATDNTVADDVTETATPDADTDTTETVTSDTQTGTTAPATDTKVNDPTSYTKDQVVKYYTESMQKSFNAPKTTIKTTQTIGISVDYVEPGGETAAKLASRIVEKYAKTSEDTKVFVKGGASDDPQYKADSFVFPVNLDPKGAKTATVTKKGNDYEINILVVSEDATLEKFPVYNKQCSFPLDLASVDLLGLKVTRADFTYQGTKIKATVGSNGYVKSAEVYMPLAGTGGGNFIGIKGYAEVSGSMKKSATFAY